MRATEQKNGREFVLQEGSRRVEVGDEEGGMRVKATRGSRPPGGGATGEEERGGGGCGFRGEARKRRVCAEFVSRVDRSRVIGHSLFLRRDYARSIYRLYSIDYTNLSAAVLLSFAPFFPRACLRSNPSSR